jgi:hypothetical protein
MNRFDAVFMLALLYSYSVWIRTPEQTSLSFEEPRFLLTCECSSFTSLPVADHVRVTVSDWQSVISMDSTGESHPNFAQWKCAVLNALSSIVPIR